MVFDPDHFLRWLEGPRGQRSEEALFEVLDAVEDASVDAREQKIIWADGTRLSLPETVERIHAQSNLPRRLIQSHVIGWLEMSYTPPGLSEQQMEEFEQLVDAWIEPFL